MKLLLNRTVSLLLDSFPQKRPGKKDYGDTLNRERSDFYVNSDEVFTPISKGVKMIYHGTVVERFGVINAIEAMPMVSNAIPYSEFTVYGFYEDAYPNQIEKLITELEIGHQVYLLKPELLQNRYSTREAQQAFIDVIHSARIMRKK